MHRAFIHAALAAAYFHPFAACAADQATIVVTATRLPTRASELLNDITVLDRAEIEAAGANNLADLLGAQPGVQTASNGGLGKSTFLFLRGSESRHAVVLVDGLRINSATAGDTALQHIPLAQIERIEILRGPASSLYGSEAIGGVVSITTRRGEGPPRPHVQASVGSHNTLDLSAGVAGISGPLRFAVTAGRLQSDGVSANVNPANRTYNPDADGYRQDNFAAQATLSLAPGHELAGTLFQSDGVSRYDNGPSSFDARLLHTLRAAGIESRNRFLPNWTSSLRLSDSVDDSTNLASATSSSVFRTRQSQAVWQNDIKTGFGTWLAGAERLEQRVSSSTVYTATQRTVDSLLAGYQGAFAGHRVLAAVRRDDNSQFGARTTGSAYYGYQFDAAWRASLGGGTSFSAPTFNQLYFPGFGDPTLRPERGRNREATLVWEQGARRFSLTGYDNRVADLIATAFVGPGPMDYRAQNVNQARLSGWTAAGDAAFGPWRLRGSLDRLDAKDQATGLQLQRRAREHATLAVQYSAGVWSVNGEAVASGARYDDVANTRRLGGYTVFNLGVDYRYAADTILFVRAVNLFDKRYELAADFATVRAGLFVGLRYQPR